MGYNQIERTMIKLILVAFLLMVSLQRNFRTVAIIGTNDIHGSALPTSLFRFDTNQTYNYGGLQFMAQMIKTIKDQYDGNVLYLDAGDQFQGGIQSSSLVSNGQIMNDFYNTIGVDASAVGNHQFDFGPKFLLPYMAGKKNSQNLAANLKSEKNKGDFLPLQRDEQLFTLKSGIKVGVIGLTTMETETSPGFANKLFPSYEFLNYTDIVLQKSKRLRSAGAHAILVLSHVGNDCNANNTFGVWTQRSKQSSQCSQTDEISKLIDSLPKGTIDGIVQGHRHKFSHHFIRGIPVMGTINGGYYFNVMYLKFRDYQIYDKQIEGPIPVCEKVFRNLKTCSYLPTADLSAAGQLVPWQFHGVTVQRHAQLQKMFAAKWLPLMTQYLYPLVKNQVFMQMVNNKENELGNLITNLMNSAVPGSDFVILNPGPFRTFWVPGILQYQHFYKMFPFNNTIVSFEMSGKELLDTLNVIQSGAKGFYQTYGLAQNVSLSSNGAKKFISAKFINGSEIQPQKSYRGVSIKFLMDGGNDFVKVIGKVYTPRGLKLEGDFRNLIKPELMKLQTIRANTLIDPSNPRLNVIVA